MSDTQLVKAAVAARAAGLNKHFLYKLAAAGKVPCYRIGRAIRFSVPELLAWMKCEAGDRQTVGVNDAR